MWGAISKSAKKLGDSAADHAKKAKIKADILMIDRSTDARKRAFGVAMYDYLSPLSLSPDFYAANDKLTEIVRPILIIAQKEIQALAARRVKQKEALAIAETSRAAAFPTKAETYGQRLMNFGKAGYLHGGETKIKTELTVTDRFIKNHKENFGVTLYNALAAAEDNDGFLPTDRQIRNVYDTCRQDLTLLEQQKKAKEDEITELGGKTSSSGPSTSLKSHAATNTTPMTMSNTTHTYSNDGNHSNSASYNGGNTSSQSSPFPTATQSSPAPQVASTGMFSHPAPNSTGYSDNIPPMDQPADSFSSNIKHGYRNPNAPTSTAVSASIKPVVDPFSTFSSPGKNSPMFNNPLPPQASSQNGHPTDLLDF